MKRSRILRLTLPLMVLSSAGPFSFWLHAQNSDSPSAEQQKAILVNGREYADEYVSRLPDFLCLQTTEQFRSGKKTDRWKQGDTLASKLVFAKGREVRTLETINGRKAGSVNSRISRRPLTTEGEFGILLANVLGSDSSASFNWSKWEDSNGNRLALFHYQMAKEHSTMKLSLSDLAQAVVPYAGDFLIDPVSGKVWRITSGTSEIPPELDTRSISTVITYAPVTIGTTEYLLPNHATVEVSTKSEHLRNELSFERYQKFETGSTVTFGQ